jgi:hypothetical protein
MELFARALAQQSTPEETEAARRYLASQQLIHKRSMRESIINYVFYSKRKTKLILMGLISGIVVTYLGSGIFAIRTPKHSVNDAVSHCLELIRLCQLAEGEFRVKAHPNAIWIEPSFGNYAALALIAGDETEDRPRVLHWLLWYASKQHADGSMSEFEGIIGSKPAEKPNSNKNFTFPATHLQVINKYYQVTKFDDKTIHASAKKSLSFLLLEGRSAYPRFLTRDVEIHAGLVAAARYFTATGDSETATSASQAANALALGLQTYWQPSKKLYAYYIDANGGYGVFPAFPEERRRTLCLANLFGLAWIGDDKDVAKQTANNKALWKKLTGDYRPDSGDAPEAPVELWYLASLNAASESEVETWKDAVITEAMEFTEENIYVQRPAITVVALVEKGNWMPVTVSKDKNNDKKKN